MRSVLLKITPLILISVLLSSFPVLAQPDEEYPVITAENFMQVERIATLPLGEHAYGRDVAFSPDGKLLAVAVWSKGVEVWEIETQTIFKSWSSSDGSWFSVAFHPNGQYLAAGEATLNENEDAIGAIHIWDMATEQEVSILETKMDGVQRLTFSPDGQSLVAAYDESWDDRNDKILIWDWENEVVTFRTQSDTSWATMALSPDGTLLAIPYGTRIRLWNLPLNTMSVIESRDSMLDGPVYDVHNIAIGSGNNLLVYDRGYSIEVYDMDRADIIEVLNNVRQISDIRLSPNGQVLAIVTLAGELILWNIQSDKSKTYEEHDFWANDVAFSPDGTMIAVASEDTTVSLWAIREN